MSAGGNGEIDRDGRTILVGDHLGPAARCKALARDLATGMTWGRAWWPTGPARRFLVAGVADATPSGAARGSVLLALRSRWRGDGLITCKLSRCR
jgi:hypothetical protein